MNKIYDLLFRKKIGKIGLKHIFKYILLVFIFCYCPLAAYATFSNLTTKSNKYAAVLLSADAITGYDHWTCPIAFWRSYPA